MPTQPVPLTTFRRWCDICTRQELTTLEAYVELVRPMKAQLPKPLLPPSPIRSEFGNSYFRIGTVAPRWVDTVPFGCYRRDVFDRIGTFDEELTRNQDDEFNMRLLRAGGKILLVPDVVCDYVARSSLRKLWAMMYQYGLFKPLVVRKSQRVLTFRQMVPALFVLSLLLMGVVSLFHPIGRITLAGILCLYISADIASAFTIARRQKISHGIASLLAFPCMHLGYGIRYWIGIWRFLVFVGN